MDYKLYRPLILCVLALMLLEVQCSPVPSAASTDGCKSALPSAVRLAKLLEYEANQLLEKHIKCDGCSKDSIPDDVPAATVSGVNFSEQLQDIYTKGVLFRFHIAQVSRYQRELLTDPEDVLKSLSRLNVRLNDILGTTKNLILQCNDSEKPQLTTAAPPQPSCDDDYEKKLYSWGVIVRLKEWLTAVGRVLEEATSDDKKARI
ncbi:uncharacterized protein LOC114441798 [Parambassis ranga]|uniref:Ciliary neurotrophic factor n=1 Tax=Parambassis ranga TaxID=210632 RepID=A0A6P7J1R1_9TELE|nr:uncharacterized protein LOC114441792 [Parambassis ranga]XP_028270687.1 uncharacterized protein LOC114441798 [Parambassis ranga]